MKKYRKILSLGIVCIAVFSTSMIAIAGTNNRAANIKSNGRIVVQNEAGNKKAVMDASDLTYLADEIDTLEDTYKTKTVEGLNGVGTYFNSDGTITYSPPGEAALPASLSFDQLMNGIHDSQKIYNEGQNFEQGSQQIYLLPNGGITTDSSKEGAVELKITAAIEENLSAGTAAWVDGHLVLGTGSDNNSYYALGYTTGVAEGLGNVDVEYTYHHHTDSCIEHVSGSCTVTWERTNFIKDNAYCGSCNHYVDTAYFTGRHSNPECNGSTLSSSSVGHCHSGGWHDDCRNDIPGNYSHSYSYNKYICGFSEGGIESAKIIFNK